MQISEMPEINKRAHMGRENEGYHLADTIFLSVHPECVAGVCPQYEADDS